MTRNTNTGQRGIYNRGKGKRPFEAGLVVTRKRTGKSFTLHIGSYPTLEDAVEGRRNYMNTL